MKDVKKIKNKYYIYILECNDNILYTGVTTDYKRRFNEHSKFGGSKKGAKFTKSHKPIRFVALWLTDTRSSAQKLESRIKKLSKEEKLLLISNNKNFRKLFLDIIDIYNYKRIRLFY